MKKIKLTQGQYAKVDDEDYEWLMKRKWFAALNGPRNSNTKVFYAVSSNPGNQSRIIMHRLIMGVKKGQEVDHIHHDTLDNRKSQLRICSHSENMMNIRKSTKNTSGFKGASWDKESGRWKSSIMINRVLINLGRYNTKEEAAKAYDEAAKKYFREFAYLNFKK